MGTPERYLIAQTIEQLSRDYEVEWEIATAIFYQESRFKTDAINWKSQDFGIGQLNYRTIQSRNVNLGKLLTDEVYAIHQTFRILAELKNKYAKIDSKQGKKWYTRYHSFTNSRRDDYRYVLEKHIKNIKKYSSSGQTSGEGTGATKPREPKLETGDSGGTESSCKKESRCRNRLHPSDDRSKGSQSGT